MRRTTSPKISKTMMISFFFFIQSILPSSCTANIIHDSCCFTKISPSASSFSKSPMIHYGLEKKISGSSNTRYLEKNGFFSTKNQKSTLFSSPQDNQEKEDIKISNNDNTNEKIEQIIGKEEEKATIDTTPRKRLYIPFLIEDTEVLFYDVVLILNLSIAVSACVVHRDNPIPHILVAFSEGSLLSLLWIGAGIYHGLFLYTAVDGHYDTSTNYITASENRSFNFNLFRQAKDENDKTLLQQQQEITPGGPKAAGMLALHAFVTTACFRIIVALIQAILTHRHVFETDAEMLMPLELIVGAVLLSCWRSSHSGIIPR